MDDQTATRAIDKAEIDEARQLSRVDDARRALSALDIDTTGDGAGDVRLADLARQIATAMHAAGEGVGPVSDHTAAVWLRPLLDRGVLAEATGLPIASSADESARTRAAAALAELAVLIVNRHGMRVPAADIAGDIVAGVLALVDDDGLTGSDAGDGPGRRRAVACVAALLDGALIADLVAER